MTSWYTLAFLAVLWLGLAWLFRDALRGEAGREVRKYIAEAERLGVRQEDRREFCRGMWEAHRAVASRGYCASRDDSIGKSALPADPFDRGFERYLDLFADTHMVPPRFERRCRKAQCERCPWVTR